MASSLDTAQAPKSQEVEDTLLYACELSGGVILPMVFQSVVNLGVLEIMDKAGAGAKLSAEEIVAKLPTTNPEAASMLDRMLRLLAGHKIVGCSQDDQGNGRRRVYHLTAVSKYFVPNEDGLSLAPLIALEHDKVFLESWFQLKDAVLEGDSPFKRAHGMHIFEYAAQNPRFNKVFNRAMLGYSTVLMNSILDRYKGLAHNIQRLVDVGGGLGVTLNMITTRYPSIKGINFDLPHVINHAPQYPGVEHVGGDMFVSVPKGDAICLKFVLHNWSDDHCVKLLKNCYNTIPENGGKVIVIESILPFVPENKGRVEMDSTMDMIMLTQVSVGKVRTEEDFVHLATKAGFRGITKECSVGSTWVMEFFK